ncbi:hypothetical protein FB384_004912 [Prauserella sediminis]|uniref:Terminase n=1 Tax=Prauserella sediminis TaxID=577680 RepID=A0A839XZZ9_9PSEU|nr:terminase family protein [Prauserella sediminis]MBB3665953.1 hypothetical protein [Prauserella sediminis]
MRIVSKLLIEHHPPLVMARSGLSPDVWQSRLLHDRPHRAIVVCSRQAGKSTVCAGKALHRAFTDPNAEIVVVSPTQRQSTLLVSKVRRFAEALGIELTRDAATFLRLTNGSTIYALPGHADTVRGYSPELLIIDEAAYTAEDLYTACLPMLAATGGDLVAISTPRGRDGWFWHEWNGEGADGWERIEVPYTEISRISEEFITQQKASMSAERFAAEYECSFNSSTFGLFNAADIAAAGPRPLPDEGGLPDPWQIMARNRAPFQAAAS